MHDIKNIKCGDAIYLLIIFSNFIFLLLQFDGSKAYIIWGNTMAWVYLFCAGILEVVWAFTMKQSAGFTKVTPTIITVIAMLLSVIFLSISMKSLPLGTAYTIWTGIGAIGAFLMGLFFLGEPAHLMRIIAASLIVSGLLMMKLTS